MTSQAAATSFGRLRMRTAVHYAASLDNQKGVILICTLEGLEYKVEDFAFGSGTGIAKGACF